MAPSARYASPDVWAETLTKATRRSWRNTRSSIAGTTPITSARSEPAITLSRSASTSRRPSGSCCTADRAESATASAPTSSSSREGHAAAPQELCPTSIWPTSRRRHETLQRLRGSGRTGRRTTRAANRDLMMDNIVVAVRDSASCRPSPPRCRPSTAITTTSRARSTSARTSWSRARAPSARAKGDLGIIPGSMGARSLHRPRAKATRRASRAAATARVARCHATKPRGASRSKITCA